MDRRSLTSASVEHHLRFPHPSVSFDGDATTWPKTKTTPCYQHFDHYTTSHAYPSYTQKDLKTEVPIPANVSCVLQEH